MENRSIDRIKELSNLNGISGFEDDVVRYVKSEWDIIGDTKVDAIKNLYLNLPEITSEKLTIQLDAHSDEVGFIVQAIKPNGLLAFLPVGGWVASNVAAQKVRVRTNSGDYISGVVASTPPHFMSEAQRSNGLTMDSLAIDVGASSMEDVIKNYNISIGAPVVPDMNCEFNPSNQLFLGKAFDCRIGVACMMDVIDNLVGEELSVNIVATMTSQEEVGLRGAEVAVKYVQPDLAIVFEGCPADDTVQEPYMIQSALNKGPMLRYFDVSMITNPEFQAYALEVAKEHNISVQVSVRSGGGTNGAAINRFNGAPAIVVGIPVRYAHTPHCYVSYKDYNAAKKLVLELIKSLDESKLSKLFFTE